MPSCSLERHVPYSAEQMFDLVIDVERYQNFMSLEFSARIIERGTASVRASQTMRIGPLSLKFESDASFQRPDWIRIESNSRPFSYFQIAWTFAGLGQGCNISIRVDCTAHSPLLEALLAPWMETFAGNLVSAFERRAAEIYSHA
ncbi:MAG TPA: type II toxin-antitoxin system RatA family toxin [Gammaproteobacteria bacterium]|nr:type II toxin-antitoxin system RatA family toxin [Gammaproteobacteria bacterium]